MTKSELLQAVQAQPFQPFRIKMVAGPTLDVRHPDFVSVPRGARTFVFYDYDKRAHRIIDLLHTQELQFDMDPPADAPDPPDGFPADNEPAAA